MELLGERLIKYIENSIFLINKKLNNLNKIRKSNRFI